MQIICCEVMRETKTEMIGKLGQKSIAQVADEEFTSQKLGNSPQFPEELP